MANEQELLAMPCKTVGDIRRIYETALSGSGATVHKLPSTPTPMPESTEMKSVEFIFLQRRPASASVNESAKSATHSPRTLTKFDLEDLLRIGLGKIAEAPELIGEPLMVELLKTDQRFELYESKHWAGLLSVVANCSLPEVTAEEVEQFESWKARRTRSAQ
jgi:hypothetical protein